MKKQILKVLVGSRAHGLNNEDSDYDYRAVHVVSTKEMLSLGYKYSGTHWCEGEEDNTSYEIGHFLHLATKSNPSILEVLVSGSIYECSDWGRRLMDLFPYIWNPQDAFNTFTGYSYNQRKKMLDRKDGRENKYAVAYIRTLINLNDLLLEGKFDLKVKSFYKKQLLAIRKGEWTFGKVLDWAEYFKDKAVYRLSECDQKQDIGKVNDFLYDIRKENWDDSDI